MTELTFLIELLLNHELPKETKDLIACRIKEVEAQIVAKSITSVHIPAHVHIPSATLNQAPSTISMMSKHGDIPSVVMPPIPQSEPVAQIAQTPAAAAALASRNAAINASLSGKTDKETGRPRKW